MAFTPTYIAFFLLGATGPGCSSTDCLKRTANKGKEQIMDLKAQAADGKSGRAY
jgi:hypothetical protein